MARAEGPALLAEQGRLHLVGHQPELESEMTTFTGTKGERLAWRVLSRRPADRNSDGSPISDGGRWAGWTLLRVELAHCRPSEGLSRA